jgi:hypothetical protein
MTRDIKESEQSKEAELVRSGRPCAREFTLTLNLFVSPGEDGAISTLFPRALVPM